MVETRSIVLHLRFRRSDKNNKEITFPNALELGVRPGWNSGLDTNDVLATTKALRIYFSSVHLPRELKICRLRTRHVVPKCLSQWRVACQLLQRERKLRYYRYMIKLRNYFTKLLRFAVQTRNDREAMRAFANGDLEQRRVRMKERTKQARKMFSSRWNVDNEWREQGMMNTRMIQMELQDMVAIRRKNESSLRLHGRRMDLERVHNANIAKECIKNVEIETKKQVQEIREDAVRVYEMKHEILKETLGRVMSEVNNKIAKSWVKRCFNRLSLMVRNRKARSIVRKRRLGNWLRICVRKNFLLKSMPSYRALRLKWKCFRGWLQYMNRTYHMETPGLYDVVSRRSYLSLWYSKCLCAVKSTQILKGGM